MGKYHLRWYNYILVFLYYSLTVAFTYGLYEGFLKDISINSFIRISLFSFYLICLVFTTYYHFKTVMADNSINNYNSEEEKRYLIDKEYCDKCNSNRPERAHHCKVCNICILRMDHHCPWIGNCIGEKNEREFIYFLLSVSVSLTLLFLLNIKYCINDLTGSQRPKINPYLNVPRTIFYNFISCIETFTCLLSLALGMAVIAVLINFLSNNVKYNMTSVEMMIFAKDYKKCPYYNENFMENFLHKIKPFPWKFNFSGYSHSNDNINNDLDNNFIIVPNEK